MFYEQKVINGILCWRNDLDGEWNEFSLQGLTTEYTELKAREEVLNKTCLEYANRLAKIQNIVNSHI